MKTAKVVIGAGYGDEGKGITTDHLAQKDCDLVVRFSGGAQAGHTVKHPNVEHVFHHFGSGTLRNVPTYLGKEFVVNPYLFLKEREKLQKKGFNPVVYVDKNCKVTTPLEVLINQKIEKYRGINRHGSCGVGINETITRHEWLPVTVDHLKYLTKYARYAMKDILYEYVAGRLMELGMDETNALKIVDDVPLQAFQDRFFDDCYAFMRCVKVVDESVLVKFGTVVFEGSQGLLLDEFHPNFPWVTRARTGIHNVHDMLINYKDEVDVHLHYVTRAYKTRHGAGPFNYQVPDNFFPKLVDTTNVPNDWQGTMRIGLLDIDELYHSIVKDLYEYRYTGYTSKTLVVTCMDQVNKVITYVKDDKEVHLHGGEFQFLQDLKDRFNWPILATYSAITPETIPVL